MKRLLSLFSVVALLAGCASNRPSGMGGLSSDSQRVAGHSAMDGKDSRFAQEACQSGAVEVEMAKLAAQNTKNKEVQAFAKKMAQDHAKAEAELSRLFSSKGIPAVPELEGSLQSSLERLAHLKGGEFDAAFKEQVIADHEKAIASFEKQAQQGTDSDLRAFAQKHLPHLREHLEKARTLPISSDTEGPGADSPNRVLQNPATRVNIPR